MSDTPETDNHPLWHGEPAVHIDFARKLERERNAAEEERVNMARQLRSEKEMHAHCQNECEKLREALALKERTLDYYRERILRDSGDWKEDEQ